MRNSSQNKLTWAVLSKWFYLINMAPFFFFLVANYLWTDCDRTNKLADYSRRFYILKHYFKLRPLANYSLAIHVNYSHCNWQFLSVLLKHHLMWLCEFFIADHFYESIFTVIYCVWIFSCMSNCETPLLWMLLLIFFFFFAGHMRRVCKLLPETENM